ncbi:MAG TPA: vanadium-dependent haloperoxidase, partial [Bacteroidia bacterium]|nr:vanadium-dependent haloperoxidase [Bacteroidia bacterium]
ENVEELDSNVVVLAAFARVGKELSFKNHALVDFEKAKIDEYTKLIGKERTDKSVEYGRKVGEAILAWSKKDNYVNIKKSSKYTIRTDSRTHWIPTSPDYAEAVEPKWMTLRPMFMDSASQFELPPPTQFDSSKTTAFYQENMKVYEECNKAHNDTTCDQREIAYFWDDNPNVSMHHGHMGFAELKLTPGGHWVAITSATCRQLNKNLIESAKAQMMVSAAVFDGFIACWHGKFQYEYIRPITYIRRYIDHEWDAFLQTPPFPEYPSGHSVVSGSAASVLTSLFGDNHAFVDSSEMPYLHGVRKFESFNAAAEEAAMSRLYGGIHYMPAVTNGITLGRSIGSNVVAELK